ncbi:MAG: c-type cytochrome [Gammaproteobacteria bacterium]|nr:c-type cytochrome [Gammaproteobacteria bacterium]
MNKVATGIFVLLFLILNNTPIKATVPKAYEGLKLYVSYCQLCHGTEGKGDGPLAKSMKITPADLSTTVRSRSDTILTKIITGEGRQTITGRDRHNLISDSMPEWKNIFTEEQVKSIIAYLRFFGKSKHKLLGDPKRGMEIYEKYCQVCHGEEGEGDGPMTNLIGISPMDHTNPNETDTLNNKVLINSIKKGRGRYMPRWEGIISDRDIEALVSYIRLLAH